MRKLLLFIICFSISLSFISCSTDVDIYAEYKDISIVYGMIEPESDTTWIKVTKAFLGPGECLTHCPESGFKSVQSHYQK
jgi:hypothetical protein